MATRGKIWSDKETLELIALWSDDVVQEELEGPRNKDVYQRICAKLHKKGFERNISQCRDKIKKLKKMYRKVVDNNNFTGRKSRKFFEELDAIFRVKPATKPSLEISSETGLPSDLSDNEEDDEETSPLPDSEEIGRDNDDNGHEEGDTSLSSPTSNKSVPSVASSSASISKKKEESKPPSKRKKPVTKLEKSLETVIGRFMEGQKDIESRYMELEEKRMQMELELEKKNGIRN